MKNGLPQERRSQGSCGINFMHECNWSEAGRVKAARRSRPDDLSAGDKARSAPTARPEKAETAEIKEKRPGNNCKTPFGRVALN
ncbi:hypothetical protein [Variovorax sp. LT1P1]|uniref:hypothetical protein n=1 Tax=Variovorax sp. LT1P1 TaxID=3443730 RepID=UPI003F499BEE